MNNATLSQSEIRKYRGMLLNRSNALDIEISDLFAGDPDSEDLRKAIYEKRETRKALAIVDAM